jgi:protein-tyrosine phosphatase
MDMTGSRSPRDDLMMAIRVSMICLGNICRSPIGEAVLRKRAQERGVDLEVCSGGTGSWHLGQGAHPQSVSVLADAGYDASQHIARQISAEWFDHHDYLLVMDQQNLSALRAMARTDQERAKIRLLRSFDPTADREAEVPDPYGLPVAEYKAVLDLVERAVDGFLDQVQ